MNHPTLQQQANLLGVTKQAIWLKTPKGKDYKKVYRKTDKYKAYQKVYRKAYYLAHKKVIWNREMNKKLQSKDGKKVFTKGQVEDFLTQSRQEWQEKLIGEVNKKYRIYFRKANGNCSYCDLCQDECACAGYNSAVYDILHILKGNHD